MTLDAAIRICIDVLKMSPEAIAMAYARYGVTTEIVEAAMAKQSTDCSLRGDKGTKHAR